MISSILEAMRVFGAWLDFSKLGGLGLLKASFGGVGHVQATHVRTPDTQNRAMLGKSWKLQGLLRVPGI